MLCAMQTATFFSGLQRRLDDARSANRYAVRHFFAQVSPQLAAAKQLDHKLAQRFNALDYLRTDELGLSRIIADLLNPRASHGQRTTFLRQLLIRLEDFAPVYSGLDLDKCEISVALEQVITSDRRIDIVVQIADGSTKYALAIENKPYAGDRRTKCATTSGTCWEHTSKTFSLSTYHPRARGLPTGAFPHPNFTQTGRIASPSWRTIKGPLLRIRTNSKHSSCLFRSPCGSNRAAKHAKPTGCAGSWKKRCDSVNTLLEATP